MPTFGIIIVLVVLASLIILIPVTLWRRKSGDRKQAWDEFFGGHPELVRLAKNAEAEEEEEEEEEERVHFRLRYELSTEQSSALPLHVLARGSARGHSWMVGEVSYRSGGEGFSGRHPYLEIASPSKFSLCVHDKAYSRKLNQSGLSLPAPLDDVLVRSDNPESAQALLSIPEVAASVGRFMSRYSATLIWRPEGGQLEIKPPKAWIAEATPMVEGWELLSMLADKIRSGQ